MVKTSGPHLAAVLSVDVAEGSDEALERVRSAFQTAVEQHGASKTSEAESRMTALLLGASAGCGGSSDPGESQWRKVQAAFAGEDYARAADGLEALERVDAWRERAADRRPRSSPVFQAV